jgi:hypothetical protein
MDPTNTAALHPPTRNDEEANHVGNAFDSSTVAYLPQALQGAGRLKNLAAMPLLLHRASIMPRQEEASSDQRQGIRQGFSYAEVGCIREVLIHDGHGDSWGA